MFFYLSNLTVKQNKFKSNKSKNRNKNKKKFEDKKSSMGWKKNLRFREIIFFQPFWPIKI